MILYWFNIVENALKNALWIPISSQIKSTLETFNQVHPWEFIHAAHTWIRFKLKKLGYEVEDGLDIKDTEDV